MFSATYPDNIRKLAEQFMKQPHMVKVEALHDAGQIEQWWYEIDPDQRLDIVARVLHSVRPTSALAFCNTKQRCKELVAELQQAGFSAEALYGELEQRDRDQILARFAGKTITALVATDVAARGLDIKDLDLVINVDVAHDPEVHIHRIGRTGRGDKHGLALTLVSPSDARRAASIEEYQKADLAWEELADLKPAPGGPLQPPMVMLEIAGGKREKLRPGDILGALTGEGGVDGKQVGKITVFEFNTFVALDRHIAQQAFERLSAGKIKAKSYKMRFVE
jgi:ATP-independent RNA helicase DbpA